MKPISKNEIEFASQVLFDGDSNKFYDDIEAKTGERIDVIKSLESININACPGSGKTTALLAKLIILANRMPFEDKRGICVLTHTNVAIDLIKEKLGAGASKLFVYPNFFGTIQSFVDKFLAVPALIEKYGVRPHIVDNDKAYAKLFDGYFNTRTTLHGKIFMSLFAKHSQITIKKISEVLDVNRAEAIKIIGFLKKGKILGSSKSPYNLSYGNSAKNYLETKLNSDPQSKKLIALILSIRKNACEIASKDISQKEELKKLRVDHINEKILEYDDPYCGFQTPSGKAFLEIKENCYQDGLLTFPDAYKLGEYYLDKYPELNLAFSERFKYVFVDEMQDTAEHQRNIINGLFGIGGDVVIQFFGDPNQAIFESEGQKDGKWNPDLIEPSTLTLNKSKRFGSQIARVINPFRIIPDSINLIEGDNTDSTIKPHLILFSKGDCGKVLKKYGELIILNELNKKKDPVFSAIGRVGRENSRGELSLKSYFMDYEKSNTKKKEYYPSFISYLSYVNNKGNSIKSFSDRIFNSILHCLELHDFKNEIKNTKADKSIIRRFSKRTFLNFLKFQHEEIYFEFKEKLIIWVSEISSEKVSYNISVMEDIGDFINEKILSIKGKVLDKSLDFFNIPPEVKNAIDESEKDGVIDKSLDKNVYYYDYLEEGKEQNLPIKINTIHGEKGESHTATLYIETYYKSYDSERIKDQLLGNAFASKGAEIDMTIKMAYVAMSRPKYLLCVAIQKDFIHEILENPVEKEKLKKRWKIEEV